MCIKRHSSNVVNAEMTITIKLQELLHDPMKELKRRREDVSSAKIAATVS
jgi:hypothetical protein